MQPEQATSLVAGIGGIFIYAHDPRALADWYRRSLGIESQYIESERGCYHEFLHRDYSDPSRTAQTVWAILTRKPGASATGQVLMVNYRVTDLDQTLAHLRAEGVTIEKTEDYDYGRFAWIADPEGNKTNCSKIAFM